MQIDDGTGTGRKVEVDVDQHLHCRAIDESLEHFANESRQEAYHMVFACSGLIAGAPFIYIKNNDSDMNIVIEGVKFHSQCSPVVAHVLNPTVTTVLGDSNTPGNVNAGAGNVANGDFYTCMSGCISGVTNTGCAVVIDRNYLCSGCGEHSYNYEMDVVIPQNKTYALFMNSTSCSGCNLAGTIPFYFSRENLHE